MGGHGLPLIPPLLTRTHLPMPQAVKASKHAPSLSSQTKKDCEDPPSRQHGPREKETPGLAILINQANPSSHRVPQTTICYCVQEPKNQTKGTPAEITRKTFPSLIRSSLEGHAVSHRYKFFPSAHVFLAHRLPR